MFFLAGINVHHERMFIIVTGPSRSGKSEWAEAITLDIFNQQTNQEPNQNILSRSENQGAIREHPEFFELIYIATATHNPDDPEWTARIQQHQQRRVAPWQTLEVPKQLAESLNQLTTNQVVLVDALGTWLANFLDLDDQQWQTVEAELIAAVTHCRANLVCVAEEVGWSVVPAYALGRLFRDRLGRLVRQLAGVADQTYLVVAGFALDLRQLGTRVGD